MGTYTVKSAMPTGKSDVKFGAEYYVQFEEVDKSFKLWYKNPPTPGQEVEGTIDDWKFVKARKEFNPNPQTQATVPAGTSTVSATVSAPKYVPFKKTDNSDGMRQGMCINNAANYVNSSNQQAISAEQWANMVHSYASALYTLGDLKATEVEETVTTIFEQ